MAIFKSGNPALNKETFIECDREYDCSKVMTISGTVNKTVILLLLTIFSSYITWHIFISSNDLYAIKNIILIGAIVGAFFGFFIVFNKDLSGRVAPIYAIAEGLSLGGLSVIMEKAFPGIVLESLFLTFSIFIVLLIIYKLRIIKVTENLKLVIASATGGVALYYIAALVMNIFNYNMPLLHENTPIGIFFSILVVVLASFNLVVDFDFIEQGVELKVPKYMEWYGAFGLLVTIIWLYIEILRLLAKLRKR